MFYSETAKTIIKLMQSSDGWSVNKYHLSHKNGFSFWIANGGFFFNGDTDYGQFKKSPNLGLIERHLLWQKAKRLVDKLQAKALSD